LLLDGSGKILKITDFGVSAVFKTQFEKEAHKLHGVFGSTPYIAPEEWIEGAEYFPTKVDVWASGKDELNAGMIFYVLLAKTLIWNIAKDDDPNYSKYLKRRDYGFPAFEQFSQHPKRLLYWTLHPDPQNRPEMSELLADSWISSIGTPELKFKPSKSVEMIDCNCGPLSAFSN
jgi:protein-serine/threonine kinase